MEYSWLLDNFNYAKNLIDRNSFPNSLIITGNKSIGKETLALEISNYFLNANKSSYREIYDNKNFTLVTNDENSKVIKIEQIRELLSKIYLRTDKRIIYIKDAEKLNISSANSLLKIIEEPPNGTKFILSTSKISSIIPTILSRCTIIKCHNPPDNKVNVLLTNKPNIDFDNYYVISKLNNKEINNSLYKNNFDLINNFFHDINEVIKSDENIINFAKKFSSYNIEQIINMILFIVINFQKYYINPQNSEFYSNNKALLREYNSEKLNFIYDKLISIKRNIDIIQNNETILFSICILFKKLSKS